MTCRTCKHWTTDKSKSFADGESVIGVGQIGECKRAVFWPDATYWIKEGEAPVQLDEFGMRIKRKLKPEHAGTKMFSCDGSGYMGALLTAEDFLCSHYEDRKDEPGIS